MYASATTNKEDEEAEIPTVSPKKKRAKPPKTAAVAKTVAPEKPAKSVAPKKACKLH